jgi:hypothetical protein
VAATRTYAHVGYRPQTGHVHSGRLFGHRDYRGKVHAVTGTDYVGRYRQRSYLTLCGDHYPVTDDSEAALAPAVDQAGTGVTCRRCRRVIAAHRSLTA